MTEAFDDVLPPQPPTGEVVHWMETGPSRFATPQVTAAAAFALGIAATVGGYMLWRYLAERRDIAPPWRWGRTGYLH